MISTNNPKDLRQGVRWNRTEIRRFATIKRHGGYVDPYLVNKRHSDETALLAKLAALGEDDDVHTPEAWR